MRTPEEIDNLFDKDGFMLPAVAGVIDTGLGEQVSSLASPAFLAARYEHRTGLLRLFQTQQKLLLFVQIRPLVRLEISGW